MKRFTVGSAYDTGAADRLMQDMFGHARMSECTATPLVG